MKNRFLTAVVAIIAALVMSLSAPATAGAVTAHPNGKVCVDIRSNSGPVNDPVQAEMRQYATSGIYWMPLIERGYCSDWYHPNAYLKWFDVYPHYQCTSQWGYVYKSNKTYTWTGNEKTILTVHCMYSSSYT